MSNFRPFGPAPAARAAASQPAPQSDWCCVIDSSLVREKIVLVEREPQLEHARMLFPQNVVYTHSEIAMLEKMAPESIRGIHDVKKTFGGFFTNLESPE